MRSSSMESDKTYDSSCSENSSDRRRFNSSAARRRSCSERIRRRHSRHNAIPAPPNTSARAIVANSSGCCRSALMDIYIQRSTLRINLVLCLTLAACRAEEHPGMSRAWPELGTMMSVAAWWAGAGGAAGAARDSVDRIDSLIQHRRTIPALDSMRREIQRRIGVTIAVDSLAPGYALDRAARALAGVVDSALLDLGGQYLWIGAPGRLTHRVVGIPDPDNTLRQLGAVELRDGSIRTRGERNAPPGAVRSVTVLAPTALAASAWAAALFELGCDRAVTEAPGVSVVCADSTGVRWTKELQNRVSLPAARAP